MIGVVAAPGTLLMTAGQIDLSVGSVTAFTSVIIAYFAVNHGLGFSSGSRSSRRSASGVINGFLVTVLEVNALITTLGTLAAFRGLSNVVANGQTVPVDNFSWIGIDRPFANIPVPVMLLLLVMLFVWALMRYTVYGRSMYAIGSNPSAARLVGVLSKRFIFFALPPVRPRPARSAASSSPRSSASAPGSSAWGWSSPWSRRSCSAAPA